MTLTYFRARLTWVAYAFEWVKCHLKGKGNGQDIDYPEKKNGPRASSAPLLPGAIFHNIQNVYWYIQQISGEHLQDHWSLVL